MEFQLTLLLPNFLRPVSGLLGFFHHITDRKGGGVVVGLLLGFGSVKGGLISRGERFGSGKLMREDRGIGWNRVDCCAVVRKSRRQLRSYAHLVLDFTPGS
jgi:hypothetical protein